MKSDPEGHLSYIFWENRENTYDKVSFNELKKAIKYWSKDKPVPQTGDKKVDYMDLRILFRLWKIISDTQTSNTLQDLIERYTGS